MGRVIWDSEIMEVEDLPMLADVLRVADANVRSLPWGPSCRP